MLMHGSNQNQKVCADQPDQKTKQHILYCSMKSAKGEPMNGNMPAVRFKANQPRVSL